MKKSDKKKYTKEHLPTKICEHCQSEMKWRKLWGKVWDEVKFCSEKCRKGKSKNI